MDIRPAQEYINSQPNGDFNTWDELYPDWRNKNVIIVRYNKPKRTYSMKMITELIIQQNGGMVMVPYTIFAVYPEDDLRVING
jgi:hypothetical protein